MTNITCVMSLVSVKNTEILKNFYKDDSLHGFEHSEGTIYKYKDNQFDILKNVRLHAPLKSKKIRGNHAPFMSKELSKAIISRSKLKNRYTKWPSRENFLAFKGILTQV